VAFLRAVFDSEAHVTKNGIIELTQKDEQLITLLSYLLASFGIPSRRKTEEKRATNGSDSRRKYHTLYVSSGRNLDRFEEAIGFTMDEKTSRLRSAVAKSRNPNHDTVVVQDAVDELSEQLHLEKGALLTETLNPESPGRENYQDDLNRVLDAAAAKLETAQEVLQRLGEVSSQVGTVAKMPATWVGEREQLEPLETRKEVESETGIRSDYLLEYADGRRTPTAARTGQLLAKVESLETEPPVERIQNELTTAVEKLNVPYERLADGTRLRGTEIINLLENEDHDLASLSRFSTITDRVRDVASEMLSESVLENIQTLNTIATAVLYYDTVESVEPVTDDRRVYDLTIPETRNYVAGTVPTVMHNTTSAVAIAKELYGDDWESNFLELNASDQRGIDVVRDRIKNFARSSFGGQNYRIIFLDEADSLTSDAQSALRRTMEQFSNNTRFILSCNYSSKIIDPIQSRCATFRFGPISDEGVTEQILKVAEQEGIETTEDGVEALVYAADGDMRKAINALQAAAVMGEVVDEEAVFTITSTARPEEIEEMVTHAIEGDFSKARSILDDLLTNKGMAGGDIIDQLHRSVWEFDLSDEATVRLMDRVGEVDYRITEGANERVQLEALLASLSLDED
jgi:DNA polymerase III delta prime subunit